MDVWGTLIVSFLGGGIVSGLIVALATAKRERTARQAEFVERQLQELYGPLQFLATSNAKLFQQANTIQDLYNKVYIQEKYSEDPGTQEQIRQEALTTLDVENDYIELAARNSDSAAELIERNYAFVDPRDADVFGAFLVDVARRRVEADDKGVQRLPFGILLELDAPSFMSRDFIEAVGARFEEKTSELEKLQGRGGS